MRPTFMDPTAGWYMYVHSELVVKFARFIYLAKIFAERRVQSTIAAHLKSVTLRTRNQATGRELVS